MIEVDVLFSNGINQDTAGVRIKESVCGVIDVIRATSSIVVLLHSGCSRVIVAADKDQAYRLKKKNPEFILCGEEGGLPPKGFDYGNSPLELSGLNLKDKTVILKTTNGTVSLYMAKDCVACFPLALLNLEYGLKAMVNQAIAEGSDLLLICSGKEGKIAYDDVFTAGMAIKHMLTMGGSFCFTDSAKLALSVALGEPDPVTALAKSSSARVLKSIGLQNDIEFCAGINQFKVKGKLVVESDLLQIKPV